MCVCVCLAWVRVGVVQKRQASKNPECALAQSVMLLWLSASPPRGWTGRAR